MNCRDFREIIDSYLSDELLTETNHEVLRHLEACGECRDETDGRRRVRDCLRKAIRSAPGFEMSRRFSVHLDSALKDCLENEPARSRPFWSFTITWATVGASLLVVLTLGFVFLGNDPAELARKEIDPSNYLVSELPEADLVNVAAGDHEHCAIRHRLDEPVVALEQASFKYKGLEDVIRNGVSSLDPEYRVEYAHACRFKDVRFAHLILRKHDKILSVLVTDPLNADELRSEAFARFDAGNYSLTRFDVDKRAVFVIGDRKEEIDSRTAEALRKPLQDHFKSSGSAAPVQVALISAL